MHTFKMAVMRPFAQKNAARCLYIIIPPVPECRDLSEKTLKPDDDYISHRQRLWTLDAPGSPGCPPSVTERFLFQPLICGTVFHRTSLLPHPPSIFCCRLKSHVFSLSYPAFWPFSHLYSAGAVTHHFGHYNRYCIQLYVRTYMCIELCIAWQWYIVGMLNEGQIFELQIIFECTAIVIDRRPSRATWVVS